MWDLFPISCLPLLNDREKLLGCHVEALICKGSEICVVEAGSVDHTRPFPFCQHPKGTDEDEEAAMNLKLKRQTEVNDPAYYSRG